MTIFSGWREQYARMRRSRDHLAAAATGQLAADSDQARDLLVHFYQDAYHLKDWLKNDPTVPASAVGAIEADVKIDPFLALCADVANGSKHFKLTSTKTGDLATTVAGQNVVVRPGTAVARANVPSPGSSPALAEQVPPRPALHSWNIQSKGQSHDALALANQVISAWDRWLNAQQLSP
jgi:hypothetical protein